MKDYSSTRPLLVPTRPGRVFTDYPSTRPDPLRGTSDGTGNPDEKCRHPFARKSGREIPAANAPELDPGIEVDDLIADALAVGHPALS